MGAGGSLMLDILVEKLKAGLMVTRIGGMGGIHDHVHVDNLVRAHLLAADALVPGSPVCGKGYFISDGVPARMFEFVRPFFKGLGYDLPKYSIPVAPLMLVMRAGNGCISKQAFPHPFSRPMSCSNLQSQPLFPVRQPRAILAIGRLRRSGMGCGRRLPITGRWNRIHPQHKGLNGTCMQSGLSSAFQRLDRTLCDSQDLWLPQPFTCDDLPWSHTHRELKDALLALSDSEVSQLHNCPQQRLNWFKEREPDLCAVLYAFEPLPTANIRQLEIDSFDTLHIPLRKWQQVVAFAGTLPHKKLPLVDWCAGKGHLSRIVQRNQRQPVHCLEWDTSLVSIGKALALQQGRTLTITPTTCCSHCPPPAQTQKRYISGCTLAGNYTIICCIMSSGQEQRPWLSRRAAITKYRKINIRRCPVLHGEHDCA